MLYIPCGSLGYVAPEILKDEGYNHQCDIFSAGVIFYAILTGKALFEGPDARTLLKNNKECNFKIHIAGGRNVFLVETVENDDPLGIVCWCSLESAAVFNPKHKVFLITLHKSRVGLIF